MDYTKNFSVQLDRNQFYQLGGNQFYQCYWFVFRTLDFTSQQTVHIKVELGAPKVEPVD
jgi:hypothetical protein